jgi:hypothetical protein
MWANEQFDPNHPDTLFFGGLIDAQAKSIDVVGTRPEIIRLSAVINKLDESEAIEHIWFTRPKL